MSPEKELIDLFDRGMLVSGSPYLDITKLPDGRLSINANIPAPSPSGLGGCWAYGNIGLFWPEKIAPPARWMFPSDNPGWWWYHGFCTRTIRYLRDVATGDLSGRMAYSIGGAIEDWIADGGDDYYSTLTPISNWYEPTASEVSDMVSYVPPSDCSAGPTATMEVLIRIDMWRERHQTTYRPDPYSGWTQRLDEATGSWPQIIEVAWRYV